MWLQEEDVMRADRITEPGSIHDHVIHHLLEDDLVIADLHKHNANVYYELAVRHTTGKPCILIAEKGDVLPFDVHGLRTIFIDSKSIRQWKTMEKVLVKTIRFVQTSPYPPDTMITTAFEMLKLRRNQGLLDVFAMMEPMRSTRALIRSAVQAGKTWQQLTSDELASVDDLCRRFDLLGLYDRLGIVNNIHVDYIYSVPFVELYEIFLDKYVKHLREGHRGMKHFWELVTFYERVRHVPSNHPVETGAPDWPEDPRKPRH